MKSVVSLVLVFLSAYCFSQRLKPGTIAVKIKPEATARSAGFPYPIAEARSIEPLKEKKGNQRNTGISILDGIYLIDVPAESRVQVMDELLGKPGVVYAEVMPEEELLHVPNDPQADPTTGGQDYLEVIKAYDAWDVTRGDPSIVIAINDTGMDTGHEDLVDKYYQNPNEELNGIDDDNNGYIDDIFGYDFADNDNSPHAETDINGALNHGTHVGGIAGATTDNGVGIAGVGYHTKISAHKGFTTATTSSTGTWEGVLYAADNGYDIANLSWGNTSGFSQFYQDIVDYCVLEKDMVLVAAAGNTNADLDYYPASYEHVLSVGASNLDDTKWSNGTYGDHLDLFAPGVSALSTQKDDSYNTDSGSSHAAPMVAAAAALVKSVFPQFNARQIMEQVRVSADDIYDINPGYDYQLGSGRLNIFRAVTETSNRSIRITDFSYDNGFGEYAFAGDTLTLEFSIVNYLAPTSSPRISLVSDSPYVTMLSGDIQPGIMNSMEILENQSMRLYIDADTPPETEINLRFTMIDGTYQDFQNTSILSGPDFASFGNEDLDMLVGGDGDVGYLEADFSDGDPIRYQRNNVLYFAGFMLGTSGSLNDNVISSFQNFTRGDDFATTELIALSERSGVPLVGESTFESNDGKYLIEQKIIPGEEAYNIIRYRIINQSSSNITGVHAGFFADMELLNGSENHAEWDNDLNALVFYDNTTSSHAVLSMLDGPFTRVALDIGSENGNTSDLSGGDFGDAVKYGYLSGADKDHAGASGAGNDVAGLLARDYGTMEVYEDEFFEVIIGFADTYEGLETIIANANDRYETFSNNPPVEESLQGCSDLPYELDPVMGDSYRFYEDANATEFISSGTTLVISPLSRDTTVYAINLDQPYTSEIVQFRIQAIDKVADFTMEPDTLYLDEPGFNRVDFIDTSVSPTTWYWDLDNGSNATVQNATGLYDTPGEYSISLSVDSDLGCSESVTKQLLVAERPASPTIGDYDICRNETIVLEHPTEAYSIYSSNGERVLKGETLELGPFDDDTTLLVAQWSSGLESLPVQVDVSLNALKAEFLAYPDTMSNDFNALFIFSGDGADTYQWSIDGQIESTSSQFSSTVSGPITLELQVSNQDCSDQVTEVIEFMSSVTPTVQDMVACAGEPLTIVPEGGTYFGFYQDESLTQLISKGQQLVLEDLTQNQTIYVVGIDDVLPSEVVSMEVSVSAFNVEIAASPASLDLGINSSVQFTANASIATAEWYVNGSLMETALSPTLLIDEPGTYEIQLIATDGNGCTSTSTIQYEAFFRILQSQEHSDLIIYPNPIMDHMNIRWSENLESITIMDLSGRTIEKWIYPTSNSFQIDLKSGTYIAEFTSSSSAKKEIRLIVVQ